MWFACLFVPHFPVQAALRCEPDQSQRNSAVAILDGPESLLRVWACNQEAELAGVEIGMTKVQAEQCPDISLRKRIPDNFRMAHCLQPHRKKSLEVRLFRKRLRGSWSPGREAGRCGRKSNQVRSRLAPCSLRA